MFHGKNNSEKEPIDHLINALNNKDSSEIIKAFHEYCSLSMEQNISEDKFESYLESAS